MLGEQIATEIRSLTALANELGGSGGAPVRARNFRHIATGQGQRLVADTSNQRLLLFAVPPNVGMLVTFVSLRSFFNLVAANREPWPFDEIDQRGYGSLRFRVNGSFISRPETNYLLLANHPCLFAFRGGDQIELIMNRADNATAIAGFPSIVNIAVRLNAYFVNPGAIVDRFTPIATNLITVPANLVQL